MRCIKCGGELDAGALFCPFCGEKTGAGDSGAPLYQAEVKGLLKSGQLLVYRDRTEFVLSQVQKMVFPYETLAAVKKGMDRINFIMDDGRTEPCPLPRKVLHEAYFTIEQASRPYLDRRSGRLSEQGVRFSFPSSPSGLGGMLNSGLLQLMDGQCAYVNAAGKSEVISYEDVRSVRVSPVGALEFTMYDGTKRAYTADKEVRDRAAAFLQGALEPFIQARKERLLAQGIYFSFTVSLGFNKGTLNIRADRLELQSGAGQPEVLPFREIRAVRVDDGSLEAALVNGKTRSFPIDREAQDQVLAYMEAAIAPYVEARTKGFDLSFGVKERLEINRERGVFHVLRQNGREISGEYPLSGLLKAEAVETRSSRDAVSALFAWNGSMAPEAASRQAVDVGVLLTVRTEQGTGNVPVCFGSLVCGPGGPGPEYERFAAARQQLFAFLEEHAAQCQIVRTVPVEPESVPEAPKAPAAAEAPAEAAVPAAEAGAQESPVSNGAVEKGQFGTLIDGITDFIGRCGTPMTIAIQGDWGTGNGSFLHMVYNALKEERPGGVLWLNTWQFSQFDRSGQLPLMLADKLIELLGGSVNEEAKLRAKMLAQGVIGIATGIISQGTSDGQKLSDALFKDDPSGSLEQKLRLFNGLVRRRTGGTGEKVIFFVDDLTRLAPAKEAEVLDALRLFFDCPGCIFMAAVDRDAAVRGRQELEGPAYTGEKADAWFDRLFKTAFRVPRSSFNIQKYITDNLGRVNIVPEDEGEVAHYGALAGLSVGRDPKALERLFNAFLLLKSLSGEEGFSTAADRLALFSLLCMQSAFPGMYRCLAQRQDRIDPALLSGLAEASPLEAQAGLSPEEAARFRAFAGALLAALGQGAGSVTEEGCALFARALTLSSITSLG